MTLRRAVRGLILSALLSVLIYTALAVVADGRTVIASVRSFPPLAAFAMVGLTLVAYAIRIIRWHMLSKVMGARATVSQSAYVQLGGMTMSVTPGKVGEVLKAFLASEVSGLPMARGVAMVFAERVADLVAVAALSAGAVQMFAHGTAAIAAAIAVTAAGVVVLGSERLHAAVLRLAEKTTWLRKHANATQEVSGSLRRLMRPGLLLPSALAAATAWGLEGVAFWLAIRALGHDGAALFSTVAVYALSTIVGALTFFPGGIGVTEASLAGLLVATGVGKAIASTATVLIRLMTLWFGVAVGWAVMATRPAVLAKLTGLGDSSGADE